MLSACVHQVQYHWKLHRLWRYILWRLCQQMWLQEWTFLEGCAPGYRECEYDGCKRVDCDDCREAKQYDLEYCNVCKDTYCSECRYLKCSKDDWAHSCSKCLTLIAVKLIPVLREENKLIPDLREENNGLKEENTQLRKEIEELRKKLQTTIWRFQGIIGIVCINIRSCLFNHNIPLHTLGNLSHWSLGIFSKGNERDRECVTTYKVWLILTIKLHYCRP